MPTISTISQETLMNILCTGTYPYNDISLDIPDQHAHLAEGESYESRCTSVLLKGGTIYFTDNQSEEEKEGYEILGTNHISTHWTEFQTAGWYQGPPMGHVVYELDLQHIISAINTNPDAYCLYNRFVNDPCSCDYWIGYNLLQTIIFGEEIYG